MLRRKMRHSSDLLESEFKSQSNYTCFNNAFIASIYINESMDMSVKSTEAHWQYVKTFLHCFTGNSLVCRGSISSLNASPIQKSQYTSYHKR